MITSCVVFVTCHNSMQDHFCCAYYHDHRRLHQGKMDVARGYTYHMNDIIRRFLTPNFFAIHVYIQVYSSDLIYGFLKQTVSYSTDQCTNIYSPAGDGVDSFYLDADGKKQMACGPVSGNAQGSYLTMLSGDGLMFGIINIVGNFGYV